MNGFAPLSFARCFICVFLKLNHEVILLGRSKQSLCVLLRIILVKGILVETIKLKEFNWWKLRVLLSTESSLDQQVLKRTNACANKPVNRKTSEQSSNLKQNYLNIPK